MGIPIVTFPHFADQWSNGTMIVENGLGVELYNKIKYTLDFEEVIQIREPVFGVDKVVTVFNEILNNPKYKMNAEKLQAISRGINGREIAVKTIENVYKNG